MLTTDEVVRVTIGPAWYDLRAQIGWYAQRQVDDARYVVRLDGHIEIARAERDLTRLRVRLLAWSRPEPISEDAVKLLPPAHAQALVDRIEQLENAEAQLGVLAEETKN
jgi:hypothetical protein